VSSGTVAVAAPSYNSVGSYASGEVVVNQGATISLGNSVAGSSIRVYTANWNGCVSKYFQATATTPGGTWRYMGSASSYNLLLVRIS
jgi:hypothetical protein